MGAADELSSLVQLAGGILFGGFALYKLTSRKDELDEFVYSSEHIVPEKPVPKFVAEAPACIKGCVPTSVKSVEIAPQISFKEEMYDSKLSNAGPVWETEMPGDNLPSWASKNNVAVRISSKASFETDSTSTRSSVSSEQEEKKPEDEIYTKPPCPILKQKVDFVDDSDIPSWMSRKEPYISFSEVKSTKPKKNLDVKISSKASFETDSTSTGSSVSSEQEEKRVEDEICIAPPGQILKQKPDFSDVSDIPSWMSRKEPCISFAEVANNMARSEFMQSGLAPAQGHFVSAEAELSAIAYQLSDVVFLYPMSNGLSNQFLGKDCVKLKYLKERNAYGHFTEVKTMETRAGAGSSVAGALLAGSRATVIANSESLKHMIPTLFEVASERLPAVFHVASYSIDIDNLSMRSDFSDVLRVRESGVALLSSSTPEEIGDMALVCHLAAYNLSMPFVHFFDGIRSLRSVQRLQKVDLSFTANRIGELGMTSPTHTHGLEVAAMDDEPFIASAVEKILTETLNFDKSYHAMEYFGPSNPQLVVVAFGPIITPLKKIVEDSYSAGVLNVRLLRPWSSAHFIRALPSSVRRICVLDQSGSKITPLYMDVACAVHSSIGSTVFKQIPSVISGKVMVDISHFDLNTAQYVISLMSSSRPPASFVVSAENVLTKRNVSLALEEDKKILLWQYGCEDGTTTQMSIKNTVRDLSAAGLNIQYFCEEDRYDNVRRTEIHFASDDVALSSTVTIKQADMVVANSLTTAVVECTKHGGFLILTSSSALKLSDNLKSRILKKDLNLFLLHADQINPDDIGMACVVVPIAKMFRESDLACSLDSIFKHVKGLHWELLSDKILHSIEHNMLSPATAETSFADDFSDVQSWASTALIDSPSPIEELDHDVKFSPRVVVDEYVQPNEASVGVVPRYKISWSIVFKEAFGSSAALRPAHHDVYTAKLTKNMRLTPLDYDRNIFHMEFDISTTPIKYEIGDALGVFGHNDEEEVDNFLSKYGLDGNEFVALPQRGAMQKGHVEYVSVRNLLIQHLDLFGRPSKRFYTSLAPYATSRYQYLRLLHIGTDDSESFKIGINETVTYAELLLQFNTARPAIEDLIQLIPEIKPRHYSISSSMKVCPRSVHLLVVAVDWTTPLGKVRTGQCTRYLNSLKPGATVTVDIQKSVLRLPPDPKQPIVMAGLGTGMAPFRAFIQERFWQMESGVDVGPCVLYFGARHKAQEWLYGEELEKYEKKGLVRLGLAWSRDQKHKIYIQHKIMEDGELLREYLGEKRGYFYLCGPTWPVPDVRDAIATGLTPEKVKGGVADVEVVENLKDEGRYILEVY